MSASCRFINIHFLVVPIHYTQLDNLIENLRIPNRIFTHKSQFASNHRFGMMCAKECVKDIGLWL